MTLPEASPGPRLEDRHPNEEEPYHGEDDAPQPWGHPRSLREREEHSGK